MREEDESEAIPTTHRAGKMTFSRSRRLRDQCWAAIEERVKARLKEHVGEILEWWAYDDEEVARENRDDRPAAVVFGPRGLCFATPAFDGERPVYVISGYLLDPVSARRFPIAHRPQHGPPHRPGWAAKPEPAPQARPGTHLVDIGLPDEARELLGNLPARVQSLLQGPFTSGQRVDNCGWYYEGDERRLAVFTVFLAGDRDVTLVTGTSTVPPARTSAGAHWDLVCHQATVVGRRGM